jgi:ribosomal-protein-alanine N-acetyltransferase
MSPRLFDPETDDVAALAALHAMSFPDGWSVASIRELFAGPGVFAFQLAGGFILARAAGGEAEILTLAVAPSARRQGRARLLIQAAAAHALKLGATTLFLEVATGNKAACALYAGLGFASVGLRKGYYAGQDADVLKTALPLPNPKNFA